MKPGKVEFWIIGFDFDNSVSTELQSKASVGCVKFIDEDQSWLNLYYQKEGKKEGVRKRNREEENK